jgi:signal transduction histidine kinase
VEVADEGTGISDELAPHVFDRGFSGAGSTGVGLALARALVEADGGRLELQQRKPALFAVFLSTADTEDGDGQRAAPGHKAPRVGEPR